VSALYRLSPMARSTGTAPIVLIEWTVPAQRANLAGDRLPIIRILLN